MTHISEIIEDILVEWAYRVHDGMPNPKNTQHIHELRESMEELNLPNKVICEDKGNKINIVFFAYNIKHLLTHTCCTNRISHTYLGIIWLQSTNLSETQGNLRFQNLTYQPWNHVLKEEVCVPASIPQHQKNLIRH